MPPTAVILLGFQNDFFSPEGILHEGVKESIAETQMLENTVSFLDQFKETEALLIATPICFSAEYSELDKPKGLMANIQDLGAFRSNSFGCRMVSELNPLQDRITSIEGKCGFNAFHNTRLNELLVKNKVESIAILGLVTSVCVDSTGRAASELGYDVTILSDCTASRSRMEQSFYCEEIFPLYASVSTSTEYLAETVGSDEILVS